MRTVTFCDFFLEFPPQCHGVLSIRAPPGETGYCFLIQVLFPFSVQTRALCVSMRHCRSAISIQPKATVSKHLLYIKQMQQLNIIIICRSVPMPQDVLVRYVPLPLSHLWKTRQFVQPDGCTEINEHLICSSIPACTYL